MPKKRSSSKAWLREHREDPYVQRAQRDGYRSRSSYHALLELQEKDRLIPTTVTTVLEFVADGTVLLVVTIAGALVVSPVGRGHRFGYSTQTRTASQGTKWRVNPGRFHARAWSTKEHLRGRSLRRSRAQLRGISQHGACYISGIAEMDQEKDMNHTCPSYDGGSDAACARPRRLVPGGGSTRRCSEGRGLSPPTSCPWIPWKTWRFITGGFHAKTRLRRGDSCSSSMVRLWTL